MEKVIIKLEIKKIFCHTVINKYYFCTIFKNERIMRKYLSPKIVVEQISVEKGFAITMSKPEIKEDEEITLDIPYDNDDWYQEDIYAD